MAQPTPYVPSFDFSDFSTLNPDTPQPGVSLDAQFNAIKLTTDEVLDNLALIQRDDGLLANGIVTPDSLSDEIYAGISRAIPWVTATEYEAGDLVWYSSVLYSANSDFTSTTNPTIDTGNWTEILDMTATVPDIITQEAQDAADAAAASAVTAAASATTVTSIVSSVGYLWAGTSTGAANTIVLAPVPAMASYVVGHKLRFLVGTTNTNSVVTMDTANGLGPRTISKNTGSGIVGLSPGDLLINTIAEIEYISDAVGYQLVNSIFSPSTITNQTTADVALDDVAVFSDTSASTNLKKTPIRNILGLVDNTPRGRLTLTTGTPVLTADVTAATTIYYTPFRGNSIQLYNGTSWDLYSFTELSAAVPATTNTIYDVFVYDNAGTLTLDLTAWSSDTARATALVLQDGIFVKSGATNRRYVGSFRTTSVSGQTQVRFGGTATGGSEAWIGIWNYYNRLPIEGVISDDTNTWNYTTATWRSANNSNTMRYSAVIGVAEDVFGAQYCAVVQNTNVGVNMAAGVGYDVTNAPDGIFGVITSPVSTYSNSAFAQTNKRPLGFHFFQALEYSVATGTSTWVGDAGVTFIKTGLSYKGSF